MESSKQYLKALPKQGQRISHASGTAVTSTTTSNKFVNICSNKETTFQNLMHRGLLIHVKFIFSVSSTRNKVGFSTLQNS